VKVYILFTTRQFARLFLTHLHHRQSAGREKKYPNGRSRDLDGNIIYITERCSSVKRKARKRLVIVEARRVIVRASEGFSGVRLATKEQQHCRGNGKARRVKLFAFLLHHSAKPCLTFCRSRVGKVESCTLHARWIKSFRLSCKLFSLLLNTQDRDYFLPALLRLTGIVGRLRHGRSQPLGFEEARKGQREQVLFDCLQLKSARL
jgi:hypothetical protein